MLRMVGTQWEKVTRSSTTNFNNMSGAEFVSRFKVSTRPVADFSVWVNALMSGDNPVSYRITNIVIHVLAGLILYGIVLRTLVQGRFSQRLKDHARTFAFVVAAIFLVHPLQTQSVSYMIQRHESLMGLVYLLVIYTLLRVAAEDCKHVMAWAGVAFVASLAGMLTKQVMVTVPVAVLLFDRAFISQGFGEALRKRGWFYGLLALTWAGLVWTQYTGSFSDDTSAGFQNEAYTPLTYLLSQGEVILMYYLKLAFYPYHQVLDYQIIGAYTRGDMIWLIAGVPVAGLLLVSLWGVIKNSWWGFLGFAFFLVLAPSSSIMPIADVIFEHRMYLPLISIIALVVFAGDWLIQKIFSGQSVRMLMTAAAIGGVLLVLSLATINRNVTYATRVSMWEDVVSKEPMNARGWHNLGSALDKAKRQDEAVECYKKVLAIVPNHDLTHNGMGKIMLDWG